jgi:hypothetical protein
MKNKLRLYIDTCVFGGYFDKEFAEDSIRLIHDLHKGKAIVLLGEPLLQEVGKANENIRRLVDEIPPDKTEYVSIDKATENLRDEYIRNGIVSKKSTFDATHVALATVNRADAIVSWNFKHIVRLSKIKGFNRINLENGFREIVIVTPKEVIFDEKD